MRDQRIQNKSAGIMDRVGVPSLGKDITLPKAVGPIFFYPNVLELSYARKN